MVFKRGFPCIYFNPVYIQLFNNNNFIIYKYQLFIKNVNNDGTFVKYAP